MRTVKGGGVLGVEEQRVIAELQDALTDAEAECDRLLAKLGAAELRYRDLWDELDDRIRERDRLREEVKALAAENAAMKRDLASMASEPHDDVWWYHYGLADLIERQSEPRTRAYLAAWDVAKRTCALFEKDEGDRGDDELDEYALAAKRFRAALKEVE